MASMHSSWPQVRLTSACDGRENAELSHPADRLAVGRRRRGRVGRPAHHAQRAADTGDSRSRSCPFVGLVSRRFIAPCYSPRRPRTSYCNVATYSWRPRPSRPLNLLGSTDIPAGGRSQTVGRSPDHELGRLGTRGPLSLVPDYEVPDQPFVQHEIAGRRCSP